MRCSILLLAFVFLLVCLPCFYCTACILIDESSLNNNELEEDLKNYDECYDKVMKILIDIDDEQQLNKIVKDKKLNFDKFSNVNALLMVGILEMLSNSNTQSNKHLDHSCAQYHIPSLIVRGLHSIHLYNKKADAVLLHGAYNDLRLATKGYIYWRSLTFNGQLSPEKIELPNLDDFDKVMMERLENNHETMQPIKKEIEVEKSVGGLYTGFLRQPYIKRKQPVIEVGYLSDAVSFKCPLDLFTPERINPIISDALKAIFPLPDDGLKRNDFWMTLALAGFRESLYYISKKVDESELSADDIYLSYLSTFLERQNIECDKNVHLLCENNDLFQTLYNQNLDSYADEQQQGVSQEPRQYDKKIAKLFKRMELELAELGGQLPQFALELKALSCPSYYLSFTGWIIQALQKQYRLFDFTKTTAVADTYNVYHSEFNTGNDELLTGDDNQKEPLSSCRVNKECAYNSNPLIRGLAHHAEERSSFAGVADLEGQNSANRASFFSRCYQWAVHNPGKAICCSLAVIGAVTVLIGLGGAMSNKSAVLSTSEQPIPNTAIATTSAASTLSLSSCRPFTEYEKVGYLVFSGDLMGGEVSDHATTDSEKAVNEAAHIQEVLARELPLDAQLIVYSNANSTSHIEDKFEPLVGKDRLHVIKVNPAENKFWSRDGVPVPVLDTAEKAGFRLVDSPYRWFQQDTFFSDAVNVTLSQNGGLTFMGGNLLADKNGNCLMIRNGAAGGLVGDKFFQYGYCCQKTVRLKHLVGIGHVDEVVKIIDSTHVLTDQPSYVQQLQDAGYKVTLLPKPKGDYATYLNSLIMNGKVFVPVYGQETDQQVIDIYKSFGLEVYPLPSTYLSKNVHGSIHCMTMTFPPRN